ncbi:MAG: MFS transporter [Bacteroidota bacterium]
MLDIQKRLTNSFYALLSLPCTAMGFALCVQIAALSWILNTKYGFNLEEIGYVWAAGPIAGILGQPLVGLLSDNIWFWNGRRRPFILVGGTIAALMILALPFLDVISSSLGIDSIIGVAITVALTLDLAINISFNPTRSIIADVTPQGDMRTKGFTIMQTVSGFFGVMAYIIGAFISNYTLIYVGAILVFVFSIIPPFYITEPRVLDEERTLDDFEEDAPLDETTKTEKLQKTNLPEFLKVCLAHAFTWLGVQTMFVYTFGYVKTVIMGHSISTQLEQAENDKIGFILGVAFAALNAVGFLFPALVLQPITERFGRVKTHMSCIAIMAIGYFLLFLYGQTTTSLVVLMCVVGIGWAAVVSLPFAIMSETVDQSRMGFYMGVFNLSVVLPQLVASGLGGYIEHQADKAVIFQISAISLAISAVLWLLVKEQYSDSASSSMAGGGGH